MKIKKDKNTKQVFGRKGWSYPDPREKDPGEYRIQRIFEIIPGLCTWTTLIGMFIFSWIVPVWAAVFIILFDIYWIYRTIYISSFSVLGHRRMRRWKKIDWLRRMKDISKGRKIIKEIRKDILILENKLKKKKDLSKSEVRELKQKLFERREFFKKAKEDLRYEDSFLDWKKVYQVILLPTAIEEAESIEPALEAIYKSNYPKDKIIILLAMEEREAKKKRDEKDRILREKYGDKFYDFISTVHKVKGSEMKCKASNATYAAKELKKYLEKKKIPLENVILSNFDCETRADPQYLAALAYAFVTEPKRHQYAYQPIPIYHNNLWDTIAPVRILVTGCSFWHMVKVMQPDEMVTFSSHSESFKTIVEMDYWPVNVISEDSLIYWKGFCYFEGDYRVKPIYLPVSMDAVLGNTYWHTIKNQYKQKHRWAYGIENFPLFSRAFLKTKNIGLLTKIKRSIQYLEGHYSWATTPFILAFLGWLPLFLGGERFNESVLAHNLPYITRVLMSLAMIGLVVSMFMSFFLLPPKPKKYSKWRYLSMFGQWFLAPFLFLLSAIPAVHSQTRIMLGKYMGEFWVTEKIRK